MGGQNTWSSGALVMTGHKISHKNQFEKEEALRRDGVQGKTLIATKSSSSVVAAWQNDRVWKVNLFVRSLRGGCSQTVVANSNERRVEIKTNCQKKQSKKTDDISKVSNGNRRKRFKNAVPVYHTHGVKMSGRVLPELGRSQHRNHIYFPVEAGQTYLMETYVL